MSTVSKIDVSIVYEMFEKITGKLDKQANNVIEPAQFDMIAMSTMAEQLTNVIDEVRKPAKVEHYHCHTIDIRSNWFFFSWVVLVIVIFCLFWVIANQRQTIHQYHDNDLKYRYVKMQGQTDEEKIYQLEQQFKYSDSIRIIRKQVEKYEELVKEQTEQQERAKRNNKELENLQQKLKSIKKQRKIKNENHISLFS
ncbi:MAG: hypothetical protein LBJ17_04890 [Dysgonamonadaceae bacterium]|jgi:hypothetical protein|nr:hypothetical protein [Dysgonamonadaceae bacterium]